MQNSCMYIYITEIGFWGRFLLKYIGTSMITVLITANDVPLEFMSGWRMDAKPIYPALQYPITSHSKYGWKSGTSSCFA